MYRILLAGAQLGPHAVYFLPSGWSRGEGACIQQTNWEMRQQGRQNRDNLKWLCLAAFVKSTKTETQFQEPLQEPSLQLTWSICVKPSHATLDVSPHERVHGVC